jgi:hypothetical protein
MLAPPQHGTLIKLPGTSTQIRQIAITNIGRDEPTLLITDDLTRSARTCSLATPSG